MARSPAPRRPRWRTFVAASVITAVFAIVLYAAASVVVYNMLSTVSAGCPTTGSPADVGDPTSFTAHVSLGDQLLTVDTTPYRMPAPETVSFAARNDPGITIAGWWEPVDRLDAPAVIIVHGSNGCRRNGGNLLVAGMLHRNGIAVLLIDMRNHGDSTVQDGRFSLGNREHRDVLGAFDWLRARGVPAGRIGVMGFSLGSAAVMIAAAREPAIAAVWADSSYTEVHELVRDGLAMRHYPVFLDAGILLAARTLTGEDVATAGPVDLAATVGARPVCLTQGDRDDIVAPHNLDELAAAIRAGGGNVTPWHVRDAGHTQAHLLHPAEYERRLVGFFQAALGGA
jgi:dipeptidyl aminopeptidase/acylaminoacyl peptidase